MFIIGINHKTAPIEIREKLYLNPLQQDLLLSELKSNPAVAEAFVLSTCNRIEVYIKRVDGVKNMDFVVSLIAKIKKLKFDFEYSKHLYIYEDNEAINHLMRVACGIDSLVLGEKQILGQVKSSVERARGVGILSKYFNVLTNIVVRAGKKAQNETDISCGGSSISWAAINMAEDKLGTFDGKSVLVIGAGKMGELALAQIHNKGAQKIYLMNRTGEKAEALAEKFSGVPVSFIDIKETLTEVDVCICSVGAPHYILDRAMVEAIMAKRSYRKLIFIDISMPRNIDPATSLVEGVCLFSIDDLDKVVGENMKKRQAAVLQVQNIIAQKISEFSEKWKKIQEAHESDYFESAESISAE
ncbi:MAG: glutamyl-tRNA reductase [Candidatus Omnitrophica bacterium]|nr:glutamyl-tRNA reductase [Candidatus Omnitrophota bacterium]